jgi:hypothetical protein
MSAFHPAVRGILEAARTQNEQARAIMRVAGDETAETVERYSEIIDGLNRMIVFTEPDVTGCSPIEGIEKMQRAHVLMGSMIARLSDYNISSWSVRDDAVSGMLHGLHGGGRDSIRIIADRLGIAYSELPHSEGKVQLHATGAIDGIAVEIWSLRTVERHCARHDTAVIDGICDGCENNVAVENFDQAEADDVREIRREMAIEAGDDSEALRQEAEDDARAARRSHEHCPGCPQCTGYADPDEPDDQDDAFGLDDNLPVTHVPKPGGIGTRCNAGEDDPVYSNYPTCPTCRSRLRGDTTPPTGERS